MERQKVFELIDIERQYQSKWGDEFDNENTINDWIGKSGRVQEADGQGCGSSEKQKCRLPQPHFPDTSRCTCAVAVLERETFAPRHYDQVTA
jgi:hypothetical protein